MQKYQTIIFDNSIQHIFKIKNIFELFIYENEPKQSKLKCEIY